LGVTEPSFPVYSTIETKYVKFLETNKDIVSLWNFYEDLWEKQVHSTPLLINNTSTIKLAKNKQFHDQTKHINAKYHLIQHHVEEDYSPTTLFHK